MTPRRFEPTREALGAALRAVRPDAYAATRNHLDGAVTALSPYITHGMLDGAWLMRWLLRHHRLAPAHKLVQELGWRAYFRHVWQWRGAARVSTLDDPHLPAAWRAWASPAPSGFSEPGPPCRSFSAWWRRVRPQCSEHGQGLFSP